MKNIVFLALILTSLFAVAGFGAVNVPITIQETVYAGSAGGVNRTADPVSVGIPFSDDLVNGVTDVNQLTLTGTPVGQFRVLGRWPSGRIKWVLVDTQANVTGGQMNQSVVLTTGGSGNFGGSDLAVDNGNGSITVNTTGGTCGTAGVICFDVRQALFNGIDRVRIGTATVVASGTSEGFVVSGPDPNAAYPGNVTCSPTAGGTACTTLYKSANDPQSTVIIEENGPVKAVLKASFDHVDANGHVYLHGTARLYFYRGKSSVKVTSILRNSDYGTSNTFATAFKGHHGYELRVKPNITGPLTYTIANDTASPSTGTLNQAGGTDSAYIYQGESQAMNWHEWCSSNSTPACVPYTPDTGYTISKNGSPVLQGSDTQFPQGWADISDSNGIGVEIGIYQMAAYWPKSLEFNGGGTDVRIGIWARQNSIPYYATWPGWQIHSLFLEFHAAPPPSLSSEFLKFQHYLIARAPYTYYNAAKVFPYQMVDPAVEDAYYTSTAQAAGLTATLGCCRVDRSTTATEGVNPDNVLHIYRFYAWRNSGGYNQAEQRFSDLENWIRRGQTGRYLNSAHFYTFQAETMGPHADGFTWRSHPGDFDGFGQPSAVSANSSLAMQLWHGTDLMEHYHWYGENDYYFMTGDEAVKDHITSSMKDWYLNQYSYQGGWGLGKFGHVNVSGTAVNYVDGSAFSPAQMNGGQIVLGNPGSVYTITNIIDTTHLTIDTNLGTLTDVPYGFDGGMYNSRSIAGVMFGGTRLSSFLSAIGDVDASAVLVQPERLYEAQVKGPLCLSGYPAGCDSGTSNGGPWHTQGISTTRGVHYGAPGSNGNSATCPGWSGRVAGMFHMSLLMQGVWELAQAKGSSWVDYWNALDNAYGLSQFDLGPEGFEDYGTAAFTNQGFRYAIFLDTANQCNYSPGDVVNLGYASVANQTVWAPFFIQSQLAGVFDERKFKIALQRDMAALGMNTSDFAGYQIGYALNALQSPASVLTNIPISASQDNGGGSYTISWTVPSSIDTTKGINGYRIKWGTKRIVDWVGFDAGANTFLGTPATTMNWFAANNVTGSPVPGAAGSTQSVTINTGIPGLIAANFSVKAYVAGGTTQPGAPSSIVLVSGNSQSGQAGQQLASPLAVKVIDGNSQGVSGVSVTFAVTAGGGKLTTTQASTDSQGLATTLFTLGANAGTNTITASSGTLVGSPVTFTATGTAVPSPAASLVLISGNAQAGTAGQQLSVPFAVKVTDASGNGVSGTTVNFAVTAGSGTLSAPAATTDASGMASVTLRLGPAAGPNTVTASSGALTGSPIVFTATAVAAPNGGGNVTWTDQPHTAGWPGNSGWFNVYFDPVSQQTLSYGVVGGSSSIYSTDLFFYNSNNNIWTHVGGYGSLTDNCIADTPTWPGNRHPISQMAIDTKRNFFWLAGGVCQGTNLSDLYYLQLNPNPLNDTWHKITTATKFPPYYAAAMAYDSDDDVLFLFGYDGGGATHDNWIFCRTQENLTPGTLTANQSAAGCQAPDDWNEVAPVGNVQPPGWAFGGMVYDPVTKKMIQFGGNSASGLIAYNQTWAYDVPTHTWSQRALNTTPPPVEAGLVTAFPAMAYNTTTNKVMFHQTSNTGAPADWQYDPLADTWTELSSSGGGTVLDAVMTYDPTKNALITLSRSAPGILDVWQGALSAGSVPVPPQNPCDLNSDGVVNLLDVQIAINQVFGVTACRTADLAGTGTCDVVDVQRVINTVLGGSCRVGR